MLSSLIPPRKTTEMGRERLNRDVGSRAVLFTILPPLLRGQPAHRERMLRRRKEGVHAYSFEGYI